MSERTEISVIVPVYNGAATLGQCLDALRNASTSSPAEILVVDDRSTDNSVEIARQRGIRVVASTHLKGPAGARNEGAVHATGSILLFIDADVVVRPDTLAIVSGAFRDDPDLIAVFGSYDTAPAAPNFLSQYKNLFHHYVHQVAREESSSFWAGCGAIRTHVFRELGGFNEQAYPNASIEDIELGWRMAQRGYRTRLMRDLQVKHLKRWTIPGLLRADILYRAVPWTKLMARSGIPNDLNLRTSQRISAVFAAAFVASILLSVIPPVPLFASVSLAALSAVMVVLLNLDFYRFFARNRGLLFTAGVFFWHVLYFLYSSATFALCWPWQKLLSGGPGAQAR